MYIIYFQVLSKYKLVYYIEDRLQKFDTKYPFPGITPLLSHPYPPP